MILAHQFSIAEFHIRPLCQAPLAGRAGAPPETSDSEALGRKDRLISLLQAMEERFPVGYAVSPSNRPCPRTRLVRGGGGSGRSMCVLWQSSSGSKARPSFCRARCGSSCRRRGLAQRLRAKRSAHGDRSAQGGTSGPGRISQDAAASDTMRARARRARAGRDPAVAPAVVRHSGESCMFSQRTLCREQPTAIEVHWLRLHAETRPTSSGAERLGVLLDGAPAVAVRRSLAPLVPLARPPHWVAFRAPLGRFSLAPLARHWGAVGAPLEQRSGAARNTLRHERRVGATPHKHTAE